MPKGPIKKAVKKTTIKRKPSPQVQRAQNAINQYVAKGGKRELAIAYINKYGLIKFLKSQGY